MLWGVILLEMEESQFEFEVKRMRREIYNTSRIVMVVTYLCTLIIILAFRNLYVSAAMIGVQIICVLTCGSICHFSDKIICKRLLRQRHKKKYQ